MFGRGVARGTEHHSRRLGPRRLGDGAGQSEVGDAQAPVLAEQQVGRLDVAVYEAAPMGVVEPACRFEADEQGLRRRQPSATVEHGAQTAASEVLEHQVRSGARALVVLAPVEHRHDVGVAEPGRRTRLGAEPLQERCVVGQRGMQDLHRDTATELDIFGDVDRRR